MAGTSMRYLGPLRGSGVLTCGGQSFGRVEFEVGGYQRRPGEVMASGELTMPAELLDAAFGRNGLVLTTDDGRALTVRFSGRRDPKSTVAHVDIGGDLPTAKEWPRRR
ncbi:MAG: hypothetical protein IBJ17_12490 [Reyranella sp.]|jgi:hypothetical protein|nr:hypothetical protein [Reyranella sp.]